MLIPDPADELITDLNRSCELQAVKGIKPDELEDVLTEKLNDLIRNDFSALIQLLYRVDVNESKLRQLLDNQSETDTGKIMAHLIIERQMEKINTRRKFRGYTNLKDDNEEKW